MGVTVSCRTAGASAWQAYLAARSGAILRALDLERYELSVSLVGDDEMRVLNRRHRGRDRTTDVLSFPLHDVAPDRLLAAPRRGSSGARGTGPRVPHLTRADRLMGDVVISLGTAARQARASRSTLARRLDVLLVHGVLHLAGYDHETSAADARRMAARARAVYAALAAVPVVESSGRCSSRHAAARSTRAARVADGRMR